MYFRIVTNVIIYKHSLITSFENASENSLNAYENA